MMFFYVLRVSLHLLVGLFTCAVIFPLTDARGRERRIKRWSGQLLNICGVAVEIQNASEGDPVPHAMIVSNHVSWLDIFVINSIHPCRFVAKSDVRDWPVIGWLSNQVGTIFISRGNKRDLRRIFSNMVVSIKAGERVAFFPEGTTAAQGVLLPFHANLFEAAIDAEVPIQPYALRYVGAEREHHAAVEFIGDMTFTQSIRLVLMARKITAHLMYLPLIETAGAHRRELAVAARASIGTALGLEINIEINSCPAPDTADNPLGPAHDLQGALL